MTQVNLEDVIADAVSDSELPKETPEVEVGTDTSSEPAPEATEMVSEGSPVNEEGVEAQSVEVGSPATRQEPVVKPEPDEFEKKFGIPAQSASGRENRIPHSRVQKIVAKAVKDAETGYLPKLQEAEGKVAQYEARLQKVAEFEKLMVNDSQKFIQLLNQLPQYQELLRPLFQPQQPAAQAEVAVADDGMPQPDQEWGDGSKVYSMEGLKALNAWNRAQARDEVLAEVEKRFGPIEQSYQAYRTVQELAPKVHNQIKEARTWPLFSENEAEITRVLQTDRNISLDGAYRQVVYPKISADRNKMREDLLREIKSAPTSTSAPARPVRSGPTPGAKRTIEEIIQEQVNTHLR